MINQDNENERDVNPNEINPEESENLINKNANPNNMKDWDEKTVLSRNVERNIPHERRNLNPDREKRAGSGGSGLDPDRNSGDR